MWNFIIATSKLMQSRTTRDLSEYCARSNCLASVITNNWYDRINSDNSRNVSIQSRYLLLLIRNRLMFFSFFHSISLKKNNLEHIRYNKYLVKPVIAKRLTEKTDFLIKKKKINSFCKKVLFHD